MENKVETHLTWWVLVRNIDMCSGLEVYFGFSVVVFLSEVGDGVKSKNGTFDNGAQFMVKIIWRKSLHLIS